MRSAWRRWVDRSAFGKEPTFGQAHQALLKALEQAGSRLEEESIFVAVRRFFGVSLGLARLSPERQLTQ
jgi:hypothetical protein